MKKELLSNIKFLFFILIIINYSFNSMLLKQTNNGFNLLGNKEYNYIFYDYLYESDNVINNTCNDPKGYGPYCDYDGDGVLNRVDLDDDNDGILDTIESSCGFSNSDIQVSFASGEGPLWNVPPYGLFDGITNQRTVCWNWVVNGPFLNITFPKKVALSDLEMVISPENLHLIRDLGGVMRLEFFNGTNWEVLDKFERTNNFKTSILKPINKNVVGFYATKFVSSTQYRVYSENTHIGPGGIFVSELLLNYNCVIDSDNDGKPNHLDLDSDSDECPDSIEGDGNFKPSDLKSNGALKGNVNSEGIITVNGTNITQNNGTSKNQNVQDSDCVFNKPPRITNNNSKETNSISFVENTIENVIDMNATDPDGERENGKGLTWSITGGEDKGLFTINNNTGELSFKSVPDYEKPKDKNKDNLYLVEVKVADKKAEKDLQLLKISIKNVIECLTKNLTGDECDFDGDGIINRDDLDDDNDGILDINECSLRAIKPIKKGSVKDIDYIEGDVDGNFAVLGREGRFKVEFKHNLKINDGVKIFWKKNDPKGKIKVSFSKNDIFYTTPILLKEGKINKVVEENLIVPIDDAKYIKVSRVDGVVGIDAIYACSGNVDKDKYLDYFDTDSDNDKCPDALEGGQDFDFDDLNDKQQLKGEVDKNGVPKLVGSKGQSVETSYNKNKVSLACNVPPVITNNNSEATNTLSYLENSKDKVVNMEATDEDGAKEGKGLIWNIDGGSDKDLFIINEETGVVNFKTSPDFENPTDRNKDNAYEVKVKVSDIFETFDTQTLTVKVLNTLECTNPLKTGPECDFDDDGIINKDDLDDDNDGILDTKEISVYGVEASQRGGVRFVDRANKIPDGRSAILGQEDFITLKLTEVLNKGDITRVFWKKTRSEGRIRVDYSSDGKKFTHLTTKLNIAKKNTITPKNVTIPKNSVTHIRVRRIGGGNIGLDAIVVARNDKDNDGFLDQFDADSDGDGCFDAIESGGVDANNDGVLDGTGISSKGLVTGGKGGYNGGTKTVLEYNGIEIKIDESSLQNKKVSATTGLELFVTGEASIATSYENGVPVYGTKGNANQTLNYQWYLEESGSLNKLSSNSTYGGVKTERLVIKSDLPVADYKYVLQVTNKEQSCFEESYDVKVSVACEIKGDAIEVLGISPSTCTPANDGSIAISKANLQANTAYKVTYTKQGESAQEKELTTDAEGKIIITDLVAGTYSGISISSLSNPGCSYIHPSEVVVPEKDLSYFGLSTSKTDETYVKAKDGVIVVNVSGLSAFEVIVTNEANQIMPRVSDFRYISLQPGLYKVKVVETATGCEQSIMVEIKSALPPDFELGAQNIMATVSKDIIGKQPISFVLSIEEIANERSSPEPIRILIKKIPGFEINYDQLLTQLNGVRRLKNKEWTMSDHPSNYVLTYTPSIANDELRNEVQRIGITGTFDVEVSTNSGNINMTIRILSTSGGEQNNLNNFVDVPITIKKE